jgi:glycosyltransferase involved in cell wall biosynthesis
VARERSLIVSLGRLEEYKGHDRLVRALPRIASEASDARLVVLGGGPDEARLRRLASDLGVSDRLELRTIPFERRAELAALLERAGLVVTLSAYESQGLAAAEAAAHGCSVLVADSSALHELVVAGLARGVDRDSTDAIVAAVLDQLRNPHRPLGNLPTWEACAKRMLEVYSSVRGAGPGGRGGECPLAGAS